MCAVFAQTLKERCRERLGLARWNARQLSDAGLHPSRFTHYYVIAMDLCIVWE